MTISDLVFLAMVLATVIVVVAILVKLLRRRQKSAGRWAMGAAAVWCLYLVVGLIVAMTTPQHVLVANEERCFDEMCFGVKGVEHFAMVGGNRPVERYTVTVETANHGRSHTEREGGAEAFLIDEAGKKYRPVGESGAGLDAPVGPGENVETRLQFDVPGGRQWLALGVEHSYWLNPGKIVIGDDEHVGHRPTVIALE